jgi:CubicO group peptidase (beta-lactamase class C family)
MNTDWARKACLPSSWAVASARSLAMFYNRLCGFDGREPLIKKETLDNALKPSRHASDPLPPAERLNDDWHMIFGLGYGLWGEFDRMGRVFGHGGAGGSEALVDRDNKLVVAFTCNFEDPYTYKKLRKDLYELVDLRWRYWKEEADIQTLQMRTSGK